jgi:TonB family protein
MKMCSALRSGFLPLLTMILLLAGLGPAAAQQLGDLEGKAKLTDAERAKRDADKVYQWIRFHADKAPPKPAASSKPTVAAAAPVIAPKPAAVAAAAPSNPSAQAARALPPVQASEPALAVATPTLAETLPEPVQVAAAGPVLRPPAALSLPPAAAPEPEAERPLELLSRVEPEFPRSAFKDIESGSVLVRFKVAPDGSVSSAEALKSSHRLLVRNTLEAVKRWRFAPIAKAREATVEIGFRTE